MDAESHAAALPQPLVPGDVDLRGMSWMPLDTARLLDSELWENSTGDEAKAAVSLWCRAWQQVPSGSLPNDETRLAKMAGVGLRRWRSVRDVALRNFLLCSDGRLYHPVICQKAMEAWAKSRKQSERAHRRWDAAADLFKDGKRPPVNDAMAHTNRQDIREERNAFPLPSLPDWLSRESWEAFTEMRRLTKHPLTRRAADMIIADLANMRTAGQDPNAALDQSTKNSWRGVFPVKGDAAAGRQGGLEARNAAAAAAWLEKGDGS